MAKFHGSGSGKTRITIRLDDDVVDWFRSRAEAGGGAGYQGLINRALREHVRRDGETPESYLRRIIRQELLHARYGKDIRPRRQ